MKTTRIFLLGFAVCLLMTCTAYAKDSLLVPCIRQDINNFLDAKDIWCSEAVETCYQTGLMKGTSTDSFSPTAPLTHAQITVIASRLQNILAGGSGSFPQASQGEDWYMLAYKSFSTAAKEAGKSLPESLEYALAEYPSDPCSRTTFVKTLTVALDISDVKLPDINRVTAVPDAYDPEILSFYVAGIVSGVDDYGNFNGNATLNRGQAAAILARIIDPSQRLSFSFKDFDLCQDVIGMKPDTVLFSIEDQDFTVQQYALYLISSANTDDRMEVAVGNKGVQEAQLMAFCHNYVAPERLAKALGLRLTDSELLTLNEAAQIKAGYKGLSEDYWYWNDSIALYSEKLESYYRRAFGNDKFGQPNGIYQELGDVAGDAYSLLDMTPHFSEINWTHIRSMLEQYPMVNGW